MKNWILHFHVITILLLASCQKEEREFIDPNIDNTIPRNSQLTDLMKNVVTHDGSFDDVIDKGHCFSVNYPYVISLNGQNVEVTEGFNYERISATDVIAIQFPITITRADHTEKIIESEITLEQVGRDCKADDDDIECIDFVYPIMISTFNNNTNRLNTIEVGHDSQMFTFMKEVDNTVSVSVNYPINLLLHNGQGVVARHNTELLSNITEAASSCNENDN